MSQLMQSENPAHAVLEAQPWTKVTQHLEESFVRDFDSLSPVANFRAIRTIRNFIVASSINKSIILGIDLIRGRIMSLTSAFAASSDHSVTLKREILSLYVSFLRDIPSFAEELLQETDYLKNLLRIVSSAKTEEAQLREAVAIFLKAIFAGDDLDQDLDSTTMTRKQVALDLFTEDHLLLLLTTSEALITRIQTLSTNPASEEMMAVLKSTLTSLVKLISLLSTDSELAMRLHALRGLQFAHKRVMATLCPRHTPLIQQDKALLLTYEASNIAPCPGSFVHTIARFSLKMIFFILFHVPTAFVTFQKVVRAREPLALISIYKHLDQPYSQCLVGGPSSLFGSKPSLGFLRPRYTSSDPIIYNTKSLHQRPLASICGGVGLVGQPDHATCIMVGLCRGVLFWRLVNTSSTPPIYPQMATDEEGVEGEVYRPPVKLLRVSSLKLAHDILAEDVEMSSRITARCTPCVVTAIDRFGNEAVTSRGLGISDDDVTLRILQPLTLNSLPLNGTRVATWACHVLVLFLNHIPSLHRCMLYTHVFAPEFDENISCILKALQSANDYEGHVDFLEQLVPLARLFTCLASTCENVRTRVGELSMIKTLIHLLITHPSLYTSNNLACLNFTHAVCQLIHALSRSMAVQCTLFHDSTIIDFLMQLSRQYLDCPSIDENSFPILVAATAAIANLQLCFMSTLKMRFQKCNQSPVSLFQSLIESNRCPSAGPHLTLQLNGVWGLASFTHALSFVMAKDSDMDDGFPCAALPRSLVDSVLVRATEILYRLSSPPSEAHEQRLSEPTIDVNCPSSLTQTFSLELHFIHQTILLLRNMSTSKMSELQLNPEISEKIFSFLSTLFAATDGIPVMIKEEAFHVLSNLLTNTDARSQFWTQHELIDSLSAFIVPTANLQVKSAALLITVSLIGTKKDLTNTADGDSPGDLFENILALLFEDTSKSSRSQYALNRSRHRSFSSSIAAARSALDTIDSVETGSGPADPMDLESLNVSARRRNELSGTSTGSYDDEPSEAEIRDAKLELFGPSMNDLDLTDAGRSLSENFEEHNGERSRIDEWESSFTGADGPLLKLLRGLLSVLLEVHSSRRLQEVWDWQLLRIERNRRKVYGHRLNPGHRFSLALQFLGGSPVTSLKELFSRLATALGVMEPATTSPNATADASLSALLARSVAVAGTVETIQSSTSEATSEVEFEDD